MLIPVQLIRIVLNFKPKTILHISAHEGEELESYLAHGWGHQTIIWIDMQESVLRKLKAKKAFDSSKQKVIVSALWSEETEIRMNVASNSESTSLLTPKDHLLEHPKYNLRSPSLLELELSIA